MRQGTHFVRDDQERSDASRPSSGSARATVALISSGDAGIYGMAGLALELAGREGVAIPIEIVPAFSGQCSRGQTRAP
jgi:precorrin-3B methylase